MCSDLISVEMMDAHPTYEEDKKICLEQGLEICEIGISSFKCLAGYKPVKKGGRYIQKEIYQSIESPFYDMHKSYLAKFKNDFNNLPTTKKALGEYDNQIEKLQKDIDAYKQKLGEYFSANPEISKAYKQRAVPFVLATIASFVVIIVVSCSSVSGELLGLMCFLLFSSFITFAVLSIVKAITYSKNRKKIESEFPSDLSALKKVRDESKVKLQSVTKTKAAFVSKNIKR